MRHVSSCLESKFDQKIPMGSVPNCRKEIADHYPIRWFKCKLKPPKNQEKLHFYNLFQNILLKYDKSKSL